MFAPPGRVQGRALAKSPFDLEHLGLHICVVLRHVKSKLGILLLLAGKRGFLLRILLATCLTACHPGGSELSCTATGLVVAPVTAADELGAGLDWGFDIEIRLFVLD